MEQKELEQLIKETVEELVQKMGFPSKVEIQRTSGEQEGIEGIVCNIQNEESSFLIGQYGVNLQSLQHIARVILRKKTDEKINFIVDVNSYRQEKSSAVEKLARETAAQVIREKRPIILRAMSSYERRIIHVELSKNSQVKTESIGEGEERKVIVKPAPYYTNED